MFHLAAQSLVRRSYADPVETYATNVHGHGERARGGARVAGDARGRGQRHQRQVLREPRVGPGLPRGRPAGRPRSLQQQQGLRRARHRRLPPLVLLKRRAGTARRDGARRQRDRRRRLGARTGWCPTSCAARSRGAPVHDPQPGRDPARGSTCWTRWRLPAARRGAVDAAPEYAGRLELRPGRARRRARCGAIAERLSRARGAAACAWEQDSGEHPHEAHYLRLDSSKARERLGWAPRWDLDHALEGIAGWYGRVGAGEDPRAVTLEQIGAFEGATPPSHPRAFS